MKKNIFVLTAALAIFAGCSNLKLPTMPSAAQSPGVTWTDATMAGAFPPRYEAAGLVFNNKMWVIAGLDNGTPLNDAWTSTDGADWALVTGNAGFSARYFPAGVVYNNELWIIGGNDGVGNYNDVFRCIRLSHITCC